jgi:hypothetical protein
MTLCERGGTGAFAGQDWQTEIAGLACIGHFEGVWVHSPVLKAPHFFTEETVRAKLRRHERLLQKLSRANICVRITGILWRSFTGGTTHGVVAGMSEGDLA